MTPRRLRSYRKPAYPTRLEVLGRPSLLLRHQPPAWRQWPELAGALGLFLLADASLQAAQPTNAPTATQKTESLGGGEGKAKAVAIVAPLFKHGEGRGATGCIVMSPPVFLSEEEALQVIQEEMKAAKVELEAKKVEIAGVSIEKRPFKADVADTKRRIAAEFVGQGDHQALAWSKAREADGFPNMSSVQSYDFPDMAGYLQEKVAGGSSQSMRLGVFYDPLAGRVSFSVPPEGEAGREHPLKPIREQELDARNQSKRLLRMQVRDFVKWLKAQGAI